MYLEEVCKLEWRIANGYNRSAYLRFIDIYRLVTPANYVEHRLTFFLTDDFEGALQRRQ